MCEQLQLLVQPVPKEWLTEQADSSNAYQSEYSYYCPSCDKYMGDVNKLSQVPLKCFALCYTCDPLFQFED